MAQQVAFLRGVNVGGHRSFRPSLLARALSHLDATSIGAAGTLVVRRPIPREQLRAEIERALPFDAVVTICSGRELERLSPRIFGDGVERPDLVRFVSVLSRLPRVPPRLPLSLPSSRGWLVRILGRQGRLVYGLYRRQMRSIKELGELDRVFDQVVTTRSWSTIARAIEALGPPGR